jgi:hypothetical protein
LLVNEELARAIRLESAVAIGHWWGVSVGVVWRWRKAFILDRMANPGSRCLILAASAKGADTIRGVALTPEQAECRRRTAIEHNTGGQTQKHAMHRELGLLCIGNILDPAATRR